MAELPKIIASEPITEPAVPEKVYDEYWLADMRVRAMIPDQPVRINATLLPSFVDTEGNREVNQANAKHVVIEDAFALAEQDADMAFLMGTLLSYVQKYATEQGTI